MLPGRIKGGSLDFTESKFSLDCASASDNMPSRLELFAIPGMPKVRKGDDLATLVIAGLEHLGQPLLEFDVLVLAQKIVSKSEGRTINLEEVTPSGTASRIAAQVGKDPRIIQIILSDTKRLLRMRHNLLITQHRLGYIMANAGVDQSNVGPVGGQKQALLLPLDPDVSAEAIRSRLARFYDVHLGVVISDSFGRPWRRGTTGVAIGAAGLPSLTDLRGRPDLFGRSLEVSVVGFADEIATAASLLQGQANEGQPAVVVRGLRWTDPMTPGSAVVRPREEDLFR